MSNVRRPKGDGPVRKPERKLGAKGSGAKLSLEQQGAVLAYASTCNDAQAAKQHGISLRTLQNYRARLASDPDLARIFAAKRRLLEDDWRSEAVKTIRAGMGVLRKQFAVAEAEADRAIAANEPLPEKRIHEVAGAVHLIGNLGIAKDALSGDNERPPNDRVGPEPPEGEGPGDGGAGGEDSPANPPLH